MSSGFDKSDLDSFFETDGVGVKAHVLGPAVTPPAVQFSKDINVIFDRGGQAIAPYPETEIDVDDPSFIAKSTDLGDVKKGYTVTFPDLASHEDGYGKTYEVARFSPDGAQTTKVTLKEK